MASLASPDFGRRELVVPNWCWRRSVLDIVALICVPHKSGGGSDVVAVEVSLVKGAPTDVLVDGVPALFNKVTWCTYIGS